MAQRLVASAAEPGSASRTIRPVDLVHLAKQCLGDEHLECEVLRLFDTTLHTYFARLQSAGNAQDIRLVLHSIKGAAGGVGAWTVADQAKAAEDALLAAGTLGPEIIADLGVAVEEVRAFIALILSNEAA